MKNTTKNIWLVGASSGIGRDLALALAKAGHRLLISARSGPALLTVRDLYPEQITVFPWDVTTVSSIENTRETVKGLLPDMDTLIYNAGTASYLNNCGPYTETTKNLFEVNFFGAIRCIDIALPLLKQQKRPTLIAGVSSLATYTALPRAEAYGASKAALRYFLDALRIDLYADGIDVCVINPGFVTTPLTDKNDFDMPWIWPSAKAAAYISNKIMGHPAEIRFPIPLMCSLKLIECLPKKMSTKLLQKMVKNNV